MDDTVNPSNAASCIASIFGKSQNLTHYCHIHNSYCFLFHRHLKLRLSIIPDVTLKDASITDLCYFRKIIACIFRPEDGLNPQQWREMKSAHC